MAIDKRREDNYRDTVGTRTFAEAEKKGKGQPRMPADNYEKLKKNVTTYGIYLLTFFGERSRSFLATQACVSCSSSNIFFMFVVSDVVH